MTTPCRSEDIPADLDYAALLESLIDLSQCESILQSQLDDLTEAVGRMNLSQVVPQGEMEQLQELLRELYTRFLGPVPLETTLSGPELGQDYSANPNNDLLSEDASARNVDMSAADEIRNHVWAHHWAIADSAMMVWPSPCQCGTKVITPDGQEVCWHTLTYSWVCPYCNQKAQLDMGRAGFEPPPAYILPSFAPPAGELEKSP